MRILFIIISFAFSFLQTEAQDTLSTKIDDNISGLKSVLKLAGSGLRIEISSGSSKFDPRDKSSFEDKKNTVNDNLIDTFFKNRPINNTLVYPYSFLNVDKDEYKLIALLGKDNFYFMDNRDMEPVYTPLSFTFMDGSTMKATKENYLSKETIQAKHSTTQTDDEGSTYKIVDAAKLSEIEKEIWNSTSFDELLLIKNAKPIKAVTLAVDMLVQKSTIYKPEKNTVITAIGTIKVDTIAGNKVYCTLPDTEQKGAITLQAYYKDGRVLRQKGYSSSTYLSPEKRKYYEAYIVILEKAKKEVTNKKINSDDELTAFVVEQIKKANLNEIDNAKYTSGSFSFSGPVSRVEFIVHDPLKSNKHFEFTDEFSYENEVYFLAQDEENNKVGIIDVKGKWVVQPQYSKYMRPWNKYYYRDQIDDYDETYWFDYKTEKLIKTPYKIDDVEIFDSKYVKIEPATNGLNGIADVTTGKIVVPMQYDYIHFSSGRFWYGRKDGKSGVLDRDFKTILPFEFQRVNVDSNFIYATSNTGIEDVYTASGVNITNGKYNGTEGNFSDGLLLVYATKKLANGNINSYYYYIDKEGKVKIDAKAAGFVSQRPFSGGLAPVRNDKDQWGFINTAGKLIIPFQYKWTFGFFPTSSYGAVQQKDENYILIDNSGKLIKNFNTDIYKTEVSANDRETRLYGRNDKVWNEYGEEIKKEKG